MTLADQPPELGQMGLVALTIEQRAQSATK